MKTLLLDIGNTRLKWGVLDGGETHCTGHVNQATIRDQGMSILASILHLDVDSVIACNVAGEGFGSCLSDFVRTHSGHDVRFVRPRAEAYGVTNSYHEPQDLGADRWAALIGARVACKSSCLIVDAGTAITIDALGAEGIHLGGRILPGIRLMADSLQRHTSELPNLCEHDSRRGNKGTDGMTLANTTVSAISEGIFGAVIGAIEGALRIFHGQDCMPTIVLTGGDAALIQQTLSEKALLRPNLILEGLVRIIEQPAPMAKTEYWRR